MRSFALALFCPLAAQAAAIARQACEPTTTITAMKEIYSTSLRGTASATVLQLPTTTAANKLKERQDCTPSVTVTETVSTTYTIHRAAQATATAAACQASNNYGLVKGSLDLNLNGPVPSVQTFPDYTIEQCCNACFNSADGCMAWSFDGSANSDAVVAGCSVYTMADGCPNTSLTQAIMYPNDDKPVVGLGACDVQVSYFSGP